MSSRKIESYTASEIECLRNNMAKNAAGYKADAKRFADSQDYATAANFMARSEAYGIICLEIGRLMGITDRQALATNNLEVKSE